MSKVWAVMSHPGLEPKRQAWFPAISKYDAVYQGRINAFCVSDNSALVPKDRKKNQQKVDGSRKAEYTKSSSVMVTGP